MHFDWAVTPADAQRALTDFIENRLPTVGRYQDAMWTGQPVLYHSRLSVAMNLKLLDPHDVVRAAGATEPARCRSPALEGFIRQILGWREYVRGIYWMNMPEYAHANALEPVGRCSILLDQLTRDGLPSTAAIGQTFEYGYAHHIQRLMVTGLYADVAGCAAEGNHATRYLAVSPRMPPSAVGAAHR